jgi:hypothetical protein
MNSLVVLSIVYVMSGNINTVNLLSTPETCVQDARTAEVTVRSMGAYNVVTNCSSN